MKIVNIFYYKKIEKLINAVLIGMTIFIVNHLNLFAANELTPAMLNNPQNYGRLRIGEVFSIGALPYLISDTTASNTDAGPNKPAGYLYKFGTPDNIDIELIPLDTNNLPTDWNARLAAFPVNSIVNNNQIVLTTTIRNPYSVRSGRWSDPATWSYGVVPYPSDTVTISAGHIVYTGSEGDLGGNENPVFGERAFGPGFDIDPTNNPTHAQDPVWVNYQRTEGWIETDPINMAENRLDPTGHPGVYQLASSVIIENTATLIIGHNNNYSIAGLQGYNNPTDTLQFGEIINLSKKTGIIDADMSNYANGTKRAENANVFDNLPSNNYIDLRGLHIMANGPKIIISQGDANQLSNTPNNYGTIANNGYMFVNGDVIATNIINGFSNGFAYYNATGIDTAMIDILGDTLIVLNQLINGGNSISSTIYPTAYINMFGGILHLTTTTLDDYALQNPGTTSSTNGGKLAAGIINLCGISSTKIIIDNEKSIYTGIGGKVGNTNSSAPNTIDASKFFGKINGKTKGKIYAKIMTLHSAYKAATGGNPPTSTTVLNSLNTYTDSIYLTHLYISDSARSYAEDAHSTGRINWGGGNLFVDVFLGVKPTNSADLSEYSDSTSFGYIQTGGEVYVSGNVRFSGVTSNDSLIVTGGKFIMGQRIETLSNASTFTLKSAALGCDNFTITESGQFIIDTNKIVTLFNKGTINSTMSYPPTILLHENSEDNYSNTYAEICAGTILSSDVTKDNVTGTFAMLSGSTLILEDTLIVNKTNRHNWYFHLGEYENTTDNITSTIEYRNNTPIMLSGKGPINVGYYEASHPFGRIRLVDNHTGSPNIEANNELTAIYIGGETDDALDYQRTTDLPLYVKPTPNVYTANNNTTSISFVNPYSNAAFAATSGEIVGLVVRHVNRSFTTSNNTVPANGTPIWCSNTIVLNDITYYFNKHTSFVFESSASIDTLSDFGFIFVSGTAPVKVSDDSEVAGRYVQFFSYTDSDTPNTDEIKITEMAIGYKTTEIPTVLASSSNISFSKGYNTVNVPVNIGKTSNTVADDYTVFTAIFPKEYIRGNAAGTYSLSDSIITGYIGGSYLDGDEIVLIKPVLISVRNGRWSDPTTWSINAVPDMNDSVKVNHIVYTGSTSSSFDGRAYGAGGLLITNGADGPNETNLDGGTHNGVLTTDHRTTPNTYQLAKLVTIDGNGALLIGQNVENTGANNAADTLQFGKIVITNKSNPANISTSTYAEDRLIMIPISTGELITFDSANSTRIFTDNFNYNPGGGNGTAGQNLKGLHIMNGGPVVHITGITEDATNIGISTNGYFYCNGDLYMNNDKILDVDSGWARMQGGKINVDSLVIGSNATKQSGWMVITDSVDLVVRGTLKNTDHATYPHKTYSTTKLHKGGMLTVYGGTEIGQLNNNNITPATILQISSSNDSNRNFVIKGGKLVIGNYNRGYNNENPTTTSLIHRKLEIVNSSLVVYDSVDANSTNIYWHGGVVIDRFVRFYIRGRGITNQNTIDASINLVLDINTHGTPTQRWAARDFSESTGTGDSTSMRYMQPKDVQAAFGMLAGSQYYTMQGTTNNKIINNQYINQPVTPTAAFINKAKNNMYFHRGTYNGVNTGTLNNDYSNVAVVNNSPLGNNPYNINWDTPAQIVFDASGNESPIWKVADSTPYGTINVSTNYGSAVNVFPDTLWIGGEVDNAFVYNINGNYGALTTAVGPPDPETTGTDSARFWGTYFKRDNNGQRHVGFVGTYSQINGSIATVNNDTDPKVSGFVIRKAAINNVNPFIANKWYRFSNNVYTIAFDNVGTPESPAIQQFGMIQVDHGPYKWEGKTNGQNADRLVMAWVHKVDETQAPVVAGWHCFYPQNAGNNANAVFGEGWKDNMRPQLIATGVRVNGSGYNLVMPEIELLLKNKVSGFATPGLNNEFYSESELVWSSDNGVMDGWETKRSGRWSDPDTWLLGMTPPPGSKVRILHSHKVYTGTMGNPTNGTTAAAGNVFDARAFGPGLNYGATIGKTEATTYQTTLEIFKGKPTVQLAGETIIDSGAALIIGHGSYRTGTNGDTVLGFGRITNNSGYYTTNNTDKFPTNINITPTGNGTDSLASGTAIFGSAANNAIKGLHIMQGAQLLLGYKDLSTENDTILNNVGFVYINGDLRTTSNDFNIYNIATTTTAGGNTIKRRGHILITIDTTKSLLPYRSWQDSVKIAGNFYNEGGEIKSTGNNYINISGDIINASRFTNTTAFAGDGLRSNIEILGNSRWEQADESGYYYAGALYNGVYPSAYYANNNGTHSYINIKENAIFNTKVLFNNMDTTLTPNLRGTVEINVGEATGIGTAMLNVKGSVYTTFQENLSVLNAVNNSNSNNLGLINVLTTGKLDISGTIVNGIGQYTGNLRNSGGTIEVWKDVVNGLRHNNTNSGTILIPSGSSTAITKIHNDLIHNSNNTTPTAQTAQISLLDGKTFVYGDIYSSYTSGIDPVTWTTESTFRTWETGAIGGKLITAVDSTDASTTSLTGESTIYAGGGIIIKGTGVGGDGAGQFIIDKNKSLSINNEGAFTIDALTNMSNSYLSYEFAYDNGTNAGDITTDNVTGNFAMLSNSNLAVNKPIFSSISTTMPTGDWEFLYFHRGQYKTAANKPATVKYFGEQGVCTDITMFMSLAKDHPYGNVIIDNIGTPLPTLVIGGESDSAFTLYSYNSSCPDFLGMDSLAENTILPLLVTDTTGGVIFVSGNSNTFYYSYSKPVKEVSGGVIARLTNNFGPAILNNKEYTFHNAATKLTFEEAEGNIEYFGLYSQGHKFPDMVYRRTDSAMYAQRSLKVFQRVTTDGISKISAMNIGYRGITGWPNGDFWKYSYNNSNDPRVISGIAPHIETPWWHVDPDPLSLMFAKDNGVIDGLPIKLSEVTKGAQIWYSSGNVILTYTATNANFKLYNGSYGTNGPSNGLASGQNIVLTALQEQIWTAIKSGRWSDPETWDVGAVPEIDAKVIIGNPTGIPNVTVYTGSTSQSFGGRAFGPNAQSIFATSDPTIAMDGPRESDLINNIVGTNLNGGDIVKLAEDVTISKGSSLIFGHNTTTTGNSGQNDVEDIFVISSFHNNSWYTILNDDSTISSNHGQVSIDQNNVLQHWDWQNSPTASVTISNSILDMTEPLPSIAGGLYILENPNTNEETPLINFKSKENTQSSNNSSLMFVAGNVLFNAELENSVYADKDFYNYGLLFVASTGNLDFGDNVTNNGEFNVLLLDNTNPTPSVDVMPNSGLHISKDGVVNSYWKIINGTPDLSYIPNNEISQYPEFWNGILVLGTLNSKYGENYFYTFEDASVVKNDSIAIENHGWPIYIYDQDASIITKYSIANNAGNIYSNVQGLLDVGGDLISYADPINTLTSHVEIISDQNKPSKIRGNLYSAGKDNFTINGTELNPLLLYGNLWVNHTEGSLQGTGMLVMTDSVWKDYEYANGLPNKEKDYLLGKVNDITPISDIEIEHFTIDTFKHVTLNYRMTDADIRDSVWATTYLAGETHIINENITLPVIVSTTAPNDMGTINFVNKDIEANGYYLQYIGASKEKVTYKNSTAAFAALDGSVLYNFGYDIFNNEGGSFGNNMFFSLGDLDVTNDATEYINKGGTSVSTLYGLKGLTEYAGEHNPYGRVIVDEIPDETFGIHGNIGINTSTSTTPNDYGKLNIAGMCEDALWIVADGIWDLRVNNNNSNVTSTDFSEQFAIQLLSSRANIKFEYPNTEIIGKITRKNPNDTTGAGGTDPLLLEPFNGDAIKATTSQASDIGGYKYYFNNKYTYFDFDATNGASDVTTFTLGVIPNQLPVLVPLPSTTEYANRLIKLVELTGNNADNTPYTNIIRNFSLGYTPSEFSTSLAAINMVMVEGYSTNNKPQKLSNINNTELTSNISAGIDLFSVKPDPTMSLSLVHPATNVPGGIGQFYENSEFIITYLPTIITSTKAGRWADPQTWDFAVPEKTDTVIINHLVYTGSTSQSFGGRAYGQGADAIGATNYEVGPNETDLDGGTYGTETTTDHRISTGQYQLASKVIINKFNNTEGIPGGALLIGHNPDNSGANDITDTLVFGTIFNFSYPLIQGSELYMWDMNTSIHIDLPVDFADTSSYKNPATYTNFSITPTRPTQRMGQAVLEWAPGLFSDLTNPSDGTNPSTYTGSSWNYIRGFYLMANGPVVRLMGGHIIDAADDSSWALVNNGYSFINGELLLKGDTIIASGGNPNNTDRLYRDIVNLRHNTQNNTIATIDVKGSTAKVTAKNIYNSLYNGSINDQVSGIINIWSGHITLVDNIPSDNDTTGILQNSGLARGYILMRAITPWATSSAQALSSDSAEIIVNVILNKMEKFSAMLLSAKASLTANVLFNGTKISGSHNLYANFIINNYETTAKINRIVNIGADSYDANANRHGITYNGYHTGDYKYHTGILLVDSLENNNNSCFYASRGLIYLNKYLINNNIFLLKGSYNLPHQQPRLVIASAYNNDNSNYVDTAELIVNHDIELKQYASIIIDTGKVVNLQSDNPNTTDGIALLHWNSTLASDGAAINGLYCGGITEEDILSPDGMQGFIMFANSRLNIISGGGIKDYSTPTTNSHPFTSVYFSRGIYNQTTPAIVSYQNGNSVNPANILNTVSTHPWGILEIVGNAENYHIPDGMYIGGEHDQAFRYGANATNDFNLNWENPNSAITFVSSNSNLAPATGINDHNFSIIGKVQRIRSNTIYQHANGVDTCYNIFGDPALSNKNYYFNNKYTILNFSLSNDIDTFGLTLNELSTATGTGTDINTANGVPPLVLNSGKWDYYAQKSLVVNVGIGNGTHTNPPAIQYISIGFSHPNEVNQVLWGKSLMFGAGYDATKPPLRLANVTLKPTIHSNSNLVQYATDNILTTPISVWHTTNTSVPLPTLINGNSLLMYRPSVFASARGGRWSDPETWLTGTPPEASDSVIIRHIVYTGLFDGGTTTGGTLFGERQWGQAETKIGRPIISNAFGINEVYLSNKVRIVDPATWSVEGVDPLTPGPSALIICAHLNGTNGLPSGSTTWENTYQMMDWNIPLVFTDMIGETLGTIRIETGNTGQFLDMDFASFLQNIAKSNSPATYQNINGLYILYNDATNIAPKIRVFNIENAGGVQNDGELQIGMP